MKALKFLFVGLTALVLCGCGSSGKSGEIEYIPVQVEEDGKWGMVSPDGEMLFSAEFDKQPTMAIEGRFMVENDTGAWEIFTAEAKPEKVGGEYKYIGAFYDGVAPATEKGKPITLIDRDGDVKVTLDTINGVVVDEVTNFKDGLAAFYSNKKWGLINTSGEAVVEAKYDEILNWGGERILAHLTGVDEANNGTYKVLDYTGKEIFEPDMLELEFTTWFDADGEALVLRTDLDAELPNRFMSGIMGQDGKWVVEPSAKMKELVDKKGTHLIYKEDNAYGVMTKEGEVVLPSKYEKLEFVTEEVLCKYEGEQAKLIDLQGNELTKEAYMSFSKSFDGVHAFAQDGEHSYMVIDLMGEPVNKDQHFYKVVTKASDDHIKNDYFDLNVVLEKLFPEDGNLIGISLDMTPREAYLALNPEMSMALFESSSNKIEGIVTHLGQQVSPVVTLKRAVGYYDSHPEEEHSCIAKVVVSLSNYEMFKGHLQELQKAICEKMRAKGAEERRSGENSTGFLLDGYIIIVSNCTNEYDDLVITLMYRD